MTVSFRNLTFLMCQQCSTSFTGSTWKWARLLVHDTVVYYRNHHKTHFLLGESFLPAFVYSVGCVLDRPVTAIPEPYVTLLQPYLRYFTS